MTRILIFDGAPASWQQELAACGAPTNPDLFRRALALHEPEVACTTQNVADGERLSAGMTLASFDGVVVTGSPLNVYAGGPAVVRQIEYLREVFAAGLPVWGSCWGLQLGATALGGEVRLNPRGRELGVARRIAVTEEGRGHPLLAGRPGVFEALCSHLDEVTAVPEGGRVLASNGVSAVQALEVETGRASFTAVQYHPEHTFATTAAIIDSRRDALVREGFASSKEALGGLVDDLRTLDADPARRDLAWRYGLDREVLDATARSLEMGNWLRTKVLPRRARRAAAA